LNSTECLMNKLLEAVIGRTQSIVPIIEGKVVEDKKFEQIKMYEMRIMNRLQMLDVEQS
jgi:hypothetical protein